jgi:arsenate reductase
MTESKSSMLVLCTGNSARSQMAEGIFRSMFGDRFDVFSAGTEPSIVRPEVIAAMAEIGIDISGHRSKSVDEFRDRDIDLVITVCDNARENCPYFPARSKLIHHSFPDPAATQGDDATRLASFRSVRDEIRAYAEEELTDVVSGLKT